MNLSVRLANQEDIVFITDLRNELRRYFLSSDLADVATTQRLIKESGVLFYVVTQEEESVGCFSLKRNNPWGDEAGHAEFGHFMIVPKYQGQGMGEKVMELAKDKARDLNITFLYLSVLADNVAALKVYLRTNFKTQRQVPATAEMGCWL